LKHAILEISNNEVVLCKKRYGPMVHHLSLTIPNKRAWIQKF